MSINDTRNKTPPVDLCPKCEKRLAKWLNDKLDTLNDNKGDRDNAHEPD